jgi:hypothetical protein
MRQCSIQFIHTILSYQFICFFVSLSFCQSIYLNISLALSLSIYFSIFFNLSLSLYLSICPSLSLSLSSLSISSLLCPYIDPQLLYFLYILYVFTLFFLLYLPFIQYILIQMSSSFHIYHISIYSSPIVVFQAYNSFQTLLCYFEILLQLFLLYIRH